MRFPIFFALFFALFFTVGCQLMIESNFSNLPEIFNSSRLIKLEVDPPIKPWHCENEYIRRVVMTSLELHSMDIDKLQMYLEETLQVVFNTIRGAWLISVSRIMRGYPDIADSLEGSQWYCLISEETPITTIVIIVVRIDSASNTLIP